MYLKNIELQGFKSFANKINFEFNEGITGIVGPNGSGKSNIADAVRWVLGAQSAKQLRGSKMEDVIFAGTENRRPVGYSQVDITIDNHDKKMAIDYLEVTISRRVYRSGESEFYINKTPCRLKDIHELFLDTGVGKEGYSIIGQGQIDKILSTKPEDRRDLFDEAAGIVKFKRRKSEAYKKLEQEKQNLLRINDIIKELEGQKGNLQGQAEVAKKYLLLKEEMKKYEVNIFITEYEKLDKNVEDISKKEKDTNEEIVLVNNKYEEIKLKYNELNNDSQDIGTKIDNKKDEISTNNLEKERIENNIKINNERISSIKVTNERIERNINEINSKHDINLTGVKVIEEEIVNLKSSIELLTSQLKEKEEHLVSISEEISTGETTIEEIKTNIIERLNEITVVKSKIQRYSTMLENIENRQNFLIDKINKVHNESIILNNKKEQLEKKITYVEEDLQQTKSETISTTNKIKEINESKHDIQEKLNIYNQQINQYKSKYNALNDITEHYEGYNYSIRKVMELKTKNSIDSVLGVVADIIKVDKKYEIAIETALGGGVQNIITKEEETAKKMINYLKTNKFGRATFLPLTSIRINKKYNPISNEKGFIGYGNDLVIYDHMYDNIIKYLLGRVVIVDKIDNAVTLARKYNYKLKIVTLSGEVLNPGGSLTGGSYKNKANNFLSRKRELDEYKNKIQQIVEEIKIATDKRTKIVEERNNLSYKSEELISKEHNLNIEMNSLQINMNQIIKDINQKQQEINDSKVELNELDNQNAELMATTEKYNEELSGTESENTDAEDEVLSLTEAIQKKRVTKNTLNEEITNLKITMTSTKQKLNSSNQNIERLDNELQDINKQKEKLNEELQNNKNDIGLKISIINKYQKDVKGVLDGIGVMHTELEILNKNKEEISLKQNAIFEERESLSEKSNLLEKEIMRLQNVKMKYELQKENITNYMWDEYELTFNMVAEYKDDLGTTLQLKNKVKELKETIKALGDVNVNAIEEYKEIITRYDFLSEQKEDLIVAKEKLIGIINELDKEMIKQFKIKFKEIKLQFDLVFKELFGGGKGLLYLVNEENVLESGINIVAQPPGKKLQSMMLLSGGERAFTAIALLFAIQRLKPSPFCVLDEIEAALDDANVERFAKYLQKLSGNTQFIIITHRRGTMEVADALYGITMQEKGISTRVSVKLIENELTG
ncbi:chromosome segregation protein SMC [Vallitalea sp.]|jgi:chromosome segregation protein|uniref:chromosome segregation protein SMC n=1 Tax=Vallitalea sp. TaxID=1882829 RepID=UPI0025F2E25E|nr:chromosome segregation protein SMC [Vallitalea sp.]MCT4687392.1 chromosome segregation protein SMC [Vallitalea sp.]